ncbi:hypothetical protein Hypma_009878 [Hypsizygus marmoreus]|uniref:Uncharacterized protein n=1 Tax=Hypsizygus marmoreus TaxID=39966 RepID=A0A369JMJ2_HYPMA|nr:hypothetical protein Hypma_009878 [Hypsizygus marmoreus]
MSDSTEQKEEKLSYTLFAQLSGEHSKEGTINAISLNSTGTYLACGGDDGKISIWATLSNERQLLHVVSGRSPVMCLIWLHSDRVLAASVWVHLCDLDQPSKTGQNSNAEVIVTALRWDDSSKRLLVAYLHHGVMLWDLPSMSVTRYINVGVQHSGFISISPSLEDRHRLAVANRMLGFDIFDLESGKPMETFRDESVHEPKTPQEFLPVLHIHDGLALLGRSHNGRVHIWDTELTGRPPIGVLLHPDAQRVSCLAAAYDMDQDRFVIATVQTGQRGPLVSIWRTQDTSKFVPLKRRLQPDSSLEQVVQAARTRIKISESETTSPSETYFRRMTMHDVICYAATGIVLSIVVRAAGGNL